MRRQFDGRRADETELSGFARRVMAPAGIAGNGSSDRRSNNNASLAPGLQVRQASMDGKKSALEIDVEYLIPVGGAHLAEPGSREDAGIAAHNVDAAMAFHRRPRHSCAVFFVRNIG